MRTIGLLGGMSWESTVPYYRHINEAVRQRLGGLHSAELILYSVDFQVIEELQREGSWAEAGRLLASAAVHLERAGAACIVLCTNTMHLIAPQIEAAVSIPLLHIGDATAAAIKRAGVATVGLLGTRFTMEQDFYVGRLRERHGINVIVPDAPDRAEVHRIVYEELCRGRILDESRAAFLRAIGRLVANGAQGVVLGCTEISLLVKPADLPVRAFDTTELHARFAVDFALSGSPEPGAKLAS
jgi:aspartate racemase